MKFHHYYYRVFGVTAAGAGAGLMFDEFVNGPFTLTPTNHEFWGLISFIIGIIFIAKYPKGKD